MRAFHAAVAAISLFCAALASVLLAVAGLIIVWMVTWRSLGNSTSWELELSIFLMVASLFLASPFTLLTKGHVGVDLLPHYLSSKNAQRLQTFTHFLGLAICLFLTWYCFQFALEAYIKNDRTESVWAPPKWPLYATMPIGLGLTALQYVSLLTSPPAKTEAY
jgi:TRAP-type C4-dicarboxylate transport system permease small subunit